MTNLDVPPHDLGAEMCLLASCMIDPEERALIMPTIKSADFYQTDHAIVWDAMKDIHVAGGVVDAVIIRSELARRKLLDQMGGTAYLAQILGSVPSAAHGKTYAKIVKEKSGLRKILAACLDAAKKVYQPHQEDLTLSISAEVASKMTDIATDGAGDDVKSIGELGEQIYDGIVNGTGPVQFVPTRFKNLDNLVGGIPLGGMLLIGGRPMMGKSWFAKRIGANIATPIIDANGEVLYDGEVVFHISLEEIARKIAANQLAAASMVPNNAIMFGRHLTPAQHAQIVKGVTILNQQKYFVLDRPVRISEVEAAIAMAKHKYKAKVVIVDFVQLINPEMSGQNENAEITKISNALKLAFKRANVAGIAAVQLNRGESDAMPKPPTLKSLRGSGTLEQDGDVVLLLHSEDYYRRSEAGYMPNHEIGVIVAKNKNNSLGVVEFLADYDTQNLREWAGESDRPLLSDWLRCDGGF